MPLSLHDLKQWVDNQPVDALLSKLRPLTDADHLLIGKLIQLMAFIDFNARRALGALQSAPGAQGRQTNVPHMQDGQVLAHLQTAIQIAPLSPEEKAGANSAWAIADQMAEYRHHLAHWATLRLPNAEVVIMMTMNAKEGRRRSGLPQEQDEFVYGLLRLGDLRSAMPKLAIASDFFSEAAGSWTDRFVEA